jgi:F0F1-type ATP synthase assembly protein I
VDNRLYLFCGIQQHIKITTVKEPKQPQNMMRYAGLATQLMLLMLIGVWGGHKLDKLLNWKVPLFLILFPLISLALSMWQLLKELNKPKK